MNNSLIRFRAELLDEITDAIQNEESGGIKELKFTELAMEYDQIYEKNVGSKIGRKK